MTNYKLNCFLCDTFDIKMKNMIYIYDLETTGLHESCEIIERCFIDYNFRTVVSDGIIKPRFGFSPFISSLTGITQDMLNSGDSNTLKFKEEIKMILDRCDKPIFIAHNGDRFDHKVLIYNNILKGNSCIFMDSKQLISASTPDKTYTKNLDETYKLITKKEKKGIHRAKVDTEMIIEIFDILKIDILKYMSSYENDI